jgi:hypothetical protein
MAHPFCTGSETGGSAHLQSGAVRWPEDITSCGLAPTLPGKKHSKACRRSRNRALESLCENPSLLLVEAGFGRASC